MADSALSANETISIIGVSLVIFVLLMLIRGLLAGIPILGAAIQLLYYLSATVLTISVIYFVYFSAQR
jgi:hypothetical protein